MSNNGSVPDWEKLLNEQAALRRSRKRMYQAITDLKRVSRYNVGFKRALQPVITAIKRMIQEDEQDLAEVDKQLASYQKRMF